MKQEFLKNEFSKMAIFLSISMFFSFVTSAQKSLAIRNGKETITKASLMKTLGRSLSKRDLAEVEPFIDQSFRGVNSKNMVQTQGGIKGFNNSSVIAMTKWITCGDYCDDINDPAQYGFCYWKCVIKGGPPAKKPDTR